MQARKKSLFGKKRGIVLLQKKMNLVFLLFHELEGSYYITCKGRWKRFLFTR